MAFCAELVRPAAETRHVRLRDWLEKRSGRDAVVFGTNWHRRYVVLANNVLFVYASPKDLKPKKVILLDDVVVLTGPSEGHPYCFSITSVSGQAVKFAAETPDAQATWVECVREAGYRQAILKREQVVLARAGVSADGAVVTDAGAAAGAGAGATDLEDSINQAPSEGGEGAVSNAKVDALVRAAVAKANARNAATVRDLKKENARLTVELAKAQHTNESIDAELNSQRRDAEGLRRALNRMEGENRGLKAQNNALLDAQADVCSKCGSELGLQNDGDTTDIIAKQHSRIADLEARIKDLVSQVDDAKTANAIMARELSEAHAKESASKRQWQRELDASRDACAKAEQDSERYLVELAAERDRATEAAAAARAAEAAAATAAKLSASTPKSSAGSATAATPYSPIMKQPHSFIVAADSPGVASITAASRAGAGAGAGAGRGAGVTAAADTNAHMAALYKHACALERAGRYADAEAKFVEVLDVQRDARGSSSMEYASASRDVGRVLSLQGRYAEAEHYYIKVVDISVAVLGEAHANTACALTDLAAVYREQEKYAKAEESAARAVTCLRRSGADPVSVATALYNLAGLSKRQGKAVAAEKSYLQALQTYQECLGDGRGETGDTLYQLASLYQKQVKYRQAAQYFGAAATAYAKAFGDTDKRVTRSASKADKCARRANAA